MGSVFTFPTGPFFEAVEQFILGVTPGPDALHDWHLGLVTGVRNGLICGLLFGLKTAWRTADSDIRFSGTLRLPFAVARKGAKGEGSPAPSLVSSWWCSSLSNNRKEPASRRYEVGRRSGCCPRGLQFSLRVLQERGIFIRLPRQWHCYWDIFDPDCV